MRSLEMVGVLVALAAMPLAAQGTRFRTDQPDPRQAPTGVLGQILGQDQQQQTRRSDKIPPGHMPPAGMCRVWIDGVPPGRQPAPTDCQTAVATKPANARVIWGDQQSFPGKGKGKFNKQNRDRDDDDIDERARRGTIFGGVMQGTTQQNVAAGEKGKSKGKGKGRGGK